MLTGLAMWGFFWSKLVGVNPTCGSQSSRLPTFKRFSGSPFYALVRSWRIVVTDIDILFDPCRRANPPDRFSVGYRKGSFPTPWSYGTSNIDGYGTECCTRKTFISVSKTIGVDLELVIVCIQTVIIWMFTLIKHTNYKYLHPILYKVRLDSVLEDHWLLTLR